MVPRRYRGVGCWDGREMGGRAWHWTWCFARSRLGFRRANRHNWSLLLAGITHATTLPFSEYIVQVCFAKLPCMSTQCHQHHGIFSAKPCFVCSRPRGRSSRISATLSRIKGPQGQSLAERHVWIGTTPSFHGARSSCITSISYRFLPRVSSLGWRGTENTRTKNRPPVVE